MTMTTSSAGIALIKQFEALHDGNPKTSIVEPMLDPIGIPTIGWGCTSYPDGKKVTLNDKPITLEQCEELLQYFLHDSETCISRYVKVDLTQNMFDALVSLVHNIGKGNFINSTLLKKLNTNCYSCAADQFLVWNKGGGRVLQGLINRRHKEKILFLS